MGKVACIYFTQYNIILLKDNLKRTKIKNIYLQSQKNLGNTYYNVYICLERQEITDKYWNKLEQLLLQLDVMYVIGGEDGGSILFDTLTVVTGDFFKRALSYHLFRYICKYKLVRREAMYANVGVVAGRFNDTLDVVIPLLEDITSLTIITEMPSMYREVISEIYEGYRLKVKVVHPHKLAMEKLDIIYDINPTSHYMNLCSSQSIYIDLLGSLQKMRPLNGDNAPSIWKDFDIVCDGYEITIPLMEAFCYAEGFSKRSLRKKIKDLDISISRVYTVGKLTMSV